MMNPCLSALLIGVASLSIIDISVAKRLSGTTGDAALKTFERKRRQPWLRDLANQTVACTSVTLFERSKPDLASGTSGLRWNLALAFLNQLELQMGRCYEVKVVKQDEIDHADDAHLLARYKYQPPPIDQPRGLEGGRLVTTHFWNRAGGFWTDVLDADNPRVIIRIDSPKQGECRLQDVNFENPKSTVDVQKALAFEPTVSAKSIAEVIPLAGEVGMRLAELGAGCKSTQTDDVSTYMCGSNYASGDDTVKIQNSRARALTGSISPYITSFGFSAVGRWDRRGNRNDESGDLERKYVQLKKIPTLNLSSFLTSFAKITTRLKEKWEMTCSDTSLNLMGWTKEVSLACANFPSMHLHSILQNKCNELQDEPAKSCTRMMNVVWAVGYFAEFNMKFMQTDAKHVAIKSLYMQLLHATKDANTWHQKCRDLKLFAMVASAVILCEPTANGCSYTQVSGMLKNSNAFKAKTWSYMWPGTRIVDATGNVVLHGANFA